MQKFEYIKKDPRYSDCIIEGELDSLNDFDFKIKCLVKRSGPDTNFKIIIDSEVYCCGETYNECLEVFFIKNNKWSYCNNINIVFENSEDHANYTQYFYKDKESVSRYAKCGGKLD